MRYPSTVRRSSPTILNDIRENPDGISWTLFCETHADIIMCYDLAIRYVLTTTPISITTFEKSLRITHNLPKHLVQRFIAFISTVPTKRILYHEGLTPMVSLKVDDNLTHVKPSSSFSIWMPSKNNKG